ncbi:hypothetical protein B0H10DRAFT_1290126 [Mycena sp. CBHHK59/15]|nr:hypothetical protein B0H10DRAFT_1290126 [Mycena sp. CBHHK59/15]
MSALANTADEWKVSFEEQVNTTFQAVQDIEQLRTRSQKLSDDNEGLKLEIAALKAEALSFKIKTVSLEQELEEAREHDRNVTVRFTEEQKSRKIAEHELNDLRSKIKALAAGVTEK